MDAVTAWPLAWLDAHVDVSRALLVSALLQLAVLGVGYLAARFVRRLTMSRTDALVERIDPRLRSPRLVAALRPLVVPVMWWAIILLESLLAGALGYSATILRVSASLLIAWIVIRATSVLVRDAALSFAIAMVVWLIAAIDILGLGEATTTALDRLAFTIGTLRLSLLSVIEAILLLSLLLWASFAISRLVQRRIATVSALTPSVQILIANSLKITLIVLAVVITLDTVGIDLTALALFSGAVGVGVGLGLQKVVANFVSGVILLLDRSVKPGDVIEIEQTFGLITSMGARYVSVRSRDGKDYLLPNEDLITHRVVNWTYSSRLVRLDIPFGVAYGTDLHRLREVAVAAATTVQRVMATPTPVCHATAFSQSSIDFVLRFWIEDPHNGVTNVKGEVLIALDDAFKAHRIELPFPQYEVRLRSERPTEAIPSQGTRRAS